MINIWCYNAELILSVFFIVGHRAHTVFVHMPGGGRRSHRRRNKHIPKENGDRNGSQDSQERPSTYNLYS